jgi:AraC family transcriptional regulator
MTEDGIRIRSVARSERVDCRLAWYPPGLRYARHVHELSQLSVLLAGQIEDSIGRDSGSALGLSLAAKPAGGEHAVIFGPQGALILSFDLSGPLDNEDPQALRAGLRWRESPQARLLVGLVAAGLVRGETPDGEAIEQVLGDLLASLADDGRARETGLPPPWLRRIREQLDTAPESTSVAAAAHEAGVHRVHLARMFRRHYGLPVSAYRRLARNAVAVRRVLGEDQVLAGAANDAGFSDQCHMTRALRADTGFTPGALCRLLR